MMNRDELAKLVMLCDEITDAMNDLTSTYNSYDEETAILYKLRATVGDLQFTASKVHDRRVAEDLMTLAEVSREFGKPLPYVEKVLFLLEYLTRGDDQAITDKGSRFGENVYLDYLDKHSYPRFYRHKMKIMFTIMQVFIEANSEIFDNPQDYDMVDDKESTYGQVMLPAWERERDLHVEAVEVKYGNQAVQVHTSNAPDLEYYLECVYGKKMNDRLRKKNKR